MEDKKYIGSGEDVDLELLEPKKEDEIEILHSEVGE